MNRQKTDERRTEEQKTDGQKVSEQKTAKRQIPVRQVQGHPMQEEVGSAETVPWSRFKLGPDGLIPCIVQDVRTEQVLMMAYMNREAYEMTCRTGRMTYFSRSRQSLWIKGETSGHFQYVRSLSADCDWDTLLAKVVQIGAACHTGSYSCFFRPIEVSQDPRS